jgi:hypothetical protein
MRRDVEIERVPFVLRRQGNGTNTWHTFAWGGVYLLSLLLRKVDAILLLLAILLLYKTSNEIWIVPSPFPQH